MVEEVPDEDER